MNININTPLRFPFKVTGISTYNKHKNSMNISALTIVNRLKELKVRYTLMGIFASQDPYTLITEYPCLFMYGTCLRYPVLLTYIFTFNPCIKVRGTFINTLYCR